MLCRSLPSRFATFTLLAALSMPALSAASLPRDVDPHGADQAIEALGQPLVSPMPGYEINSGFGWRKHPVLKRTKFHAGVDFSALTGTPVLAAGDGVIETIERRRDRGLYVVIRHGERVSTGYAHLSDVREGLAVGQSVSAQEPIAYVGRSGRTTGAHLDFEVFCDGQRVNPEQVIVAADLAEPAADDAQPTYGSGKFVTFRDYPAF